MKSLSSKAWKNIVYAVGIFYIIESIADIFSGIILSEYRFIPTDILNIIAGVMLLRHSNICRIYLAIMSGIYLLISLLTAAIFVFIPELHNEFEGTVFKLVCGLLPLLLILFAGALFILLNHRTRELFTMPDKGKKALPADQLP